MNNPTDKEKASLEERVARIEAWIDKWEGIGEEPYDSGWSEYRKENS